MPSRLVDKITERPSGGGSIAQQLLMTDEHDFRFIPIEDFADMTSYTGPEGQERLAREAQLSRQMHERLIADTASRGEIYAPDYVIDYAENEQFWHDYFTRMVRPHALPQPPEPVRKLNALASTPDRPPALRPLRVVATNARPYDAGRPTVESGD